MFNPEEETLVTSPVLGKVLSITDERIRQLDDQGILNSTVKGRKRYYDLVPNVNEYIDYIKNADEGVKAAIAAAELKYKEARGNKAELEFQELKGQMHRADDVRIVVSDMIARLRAAILALPGRLAVDCAEAKTPTEASAVIKSAVDDLLNETAEVQYKAADYRRLVAEREKWISANEEQKKPERPAEEKQPEKKTPAKKAPAKKTAEKQPAKKTPAKKASTKTSGKQSASSKTSAKTSKPRKTSQ